MKQKKNKNYQMKDIRRKNIDKKTIERLVDKAYEIYGKALRRLAYH